MPEHPADRLTRVYSPHVVQFRWDSDHGFHWRVLRRPMTWHFADNPSCELFVCDDCARRGPARRITFRLDVPPHESRPGYSPRRLCTGCWSRRAAPIRRLRAADDIARLARKLEREARRGHQSR